MNEKTLGIIFILFILSIFLLVVVLASSGSEVKAQTNNPCKQYFDKAVELVLKAEKQSFADSMMVNATTSVAYSKIYENCRNMNFKNR